MAWEPRSVAERRRTLAAAAQRWRNGRFHSEGPGFYDRAYAVFGPYATQGPYTTTLTPEQETQFRSWVQSNRVPFDPDAQRADYDMRGYWLETGGAPHSAGTHFTDKYKTPYDTTFSAESKYAAPGNPFKWRGDRLVDTRTGEVIFTPAARRR